MVDEPVTVVVSLKGWVRALKGHEIDAATLAFKAGDALYGTFPCRSVDTLLVFGSNGRVYSTAVAGLPGGRGDGQPITTLIDLETGTQPAHYFAGARDADAAAGRHRRLRPAGARGRPASRARRGGKSFLSLEADEKPLPPSAGGRRDAGGLPVAGRPAAGLRARRAEAAAQRRPRPDADGPRCEGRAGQRGRLRRRRCRCSARAAAASRGGDAQGRRAGRLRRQARAQGQGGRGHEGAAGRAARAERRGTQVLRRRSTQITAATSSTYSPRLQNS